MKLIARVTDKILGDGWPIKHVSYSRDSEVLDITVTHSPTWTSGDLRIVDWHSLLRDHPTLGEIEFADGYYLLTRNPDDSAWDVTKER